MSDLTKALFLALAILYVISPIDACPGPIDDIIVLVLTLAAQRN